MYCDLVGPLFQFALSHIILDVGPKDYALKIF